MIIFFGVVGVVQAAGLGVSFQSSPLFYNTNIAPGENIDRTVTVTNNGTENENVYFSTVNNTSTGLAEVMLLSVESGAVNYYNDYYSDLFNDEEISLGVLAPGQSRTYVFTSSFASTADDGYQSKTMGFDLCVGFSGGGLQCDGLAAVTSSSGGGGFLTLRLLNETVGSTDVIKGSGLITWDTNRPASSYLICGDATHGPFDLDPNAPFLGYEFEVAEINEAVTEHSVEVVVDTPGAYECRPASRTTSGRGFTVGNPVRFSIPAGAVAGVNFSAPTAQTVTTFTSETSEPNLYQGGEVLGASTSIAEADKNEPEGQVAGAVTALADTVQNATKDCFFSWLLLLLVISFSWSVIDDVIRHQHTIFRPLFARHCIFAIAYISLLIFASWFRVLNSFWWIFMLGWVIFVAYDFRSHTMLDGLYESRFRLWFYVLTGTIFATTSIWLGFSCGWWLFVALGAILFLFFLIR